MGRMAAALAGCALACAAVPGPAAAGPPGPPTPPPPCSFVLSAPAVEGSTVVATVTSVGCAPAAAPYLSVACLAPSGAAMQCAQGRGGDPALVSVPHQPGIAYTATGRGCAGWGQLPPFPHCQALGPLGATL